MQSVSDFIIFMIQNQDGTIAEYDRFKPSVLEQTQIFNLTTQLLVAGVI